MSKLIYILIIILLIGCSSKVNISNDSNDFVNKQHEFGTILLIKEASCLFEFTNPGKTPLLIFKVKTTCGCTVPQWPKKTISPGKNGLIKVNYDAAFSGVFHKTISVFYNGQGSPLELEIKGNVKLPEEISDDDKK